MVFDLMREQEYIEIATQESNADFSLINLKGFPYSVYQSNKVRYKELYRWFSGEMLEVKQKQGTVTVDKYPIKINPIRGACYKHAYALFGEVPDDSRPLVVPRLKPDNRDQSGLAQRADEVLYKIWWENNGRSLMIRNALLSQIYGGCVFKVAALDRNNMLNMLLRSIPLKIEMVHPMNWIGLPYAGEEYMLQESWVIKIISAHEARKLGVEVKDTQTSLYYVEYWSPDEFYAKINDMSIPTGQINSKGKEIFYEGRNPWGFVPLVYMPHIRASNFFGESLITNNVQGIVEEINTREADKGDAASQDSHKKFVGIDIQGEIRSETLADGSRVYLIKSVPQMGGNSPQADLKEMSSQHSSEPMRMLTKDLYDHFRREAFIPAVADGEDEGSQRSALTLAMRMWPLTSHTNTERVYWADGLAILNHMILKMIMIGEMIKDFPVKPLKYRIEMKWAPILPIDRQAFIEELVSRAGTNLGSPQTLLANLDDVEDPEEELVEIKKYLTWLMEMEKEAAKKFAPDPQTSSEKESKSKSKSTPTEKPKKE